MDMVGLENSGSPKKPRLVWRGAFYLPDGTALPGIAIVSSSQPTFPSNGRSKDDRDPSPSESQHVVHTATEHSLPDGHQRHSFPLSSEMQDDLCLSLEMVRHAPLHVVETIDAVHGTKESLHSLIQTVNSGPVQTIFQPSQDVRLYIDPIHESTVAFFERVFCYEDSRFVTPEGCGERPCCSYRVLVFSVDKLYRKVIQPGMEAADAFSEDAWHSSTNSLCTKSANNSTEAVVMGIRCGQGKDQKMQLHIGKKVTNRLPLGNGGAFRLPTAGARPDDPAPRHVVRTLSGKQELSRLAPLPLEGSKGKNQETLLRKDNLSREHIAPHSPTSSSRKRGGNHTPGRRGEKRTVVPDTEKEGAPPPSSNFEERNRSLIKKLVHYQLLGKGVERHDDAYLACFGTTCQGALVAFRHTVKTDIIDRQKAASVIERHLDMYL